MRRATSCDIQEPSGGHPISIHALLAESDIVYPVKNDKTRLFLSTLSLRRATKQPLQLPLLHRYFYPRSPCGERHFLRPGRGIRTRHFYPRSPCGERRKTVKSGFCKQIISIHALLAESDWQSQRPTRGPALFLSTLSLRRATLGETIPGGRHINFYPRSPCGERRYRISAR